MVEWSIIIIYKNKKIKNYHGKGGFLGVEWGHMPPLNPPGSTLGSFHHNFPVSVKLLLISKA
jgi:hypothetical protein